MAQNVKTPRRAEPRGAFESVLGKERLEGSPAASASQVSRLISEARAASLRHLHAGLTGSGAQAEAALNLGAFYSAQAARLALFTGGLS